MIEYILSGTFGAVVVGYFVWSARQNQRFMQRLIENHLDHNTAALALMHDAVVAGSLEAAAAARAAATAAAELLAAVNHHGLDRPPRP